MGEQDLTRMAARIALGSPGPAAPARAHATPWDVTSTMDECRSYVSDIWASVQTGHARPDAGSAAQEAFGQACGSATSELLKAKAYIERIWASTRPKKRKWETKCGASNIPKT